MSPNYWGRVPTGSSMDRSSPSRLIVASTSSPGLSSIASTDDRCEGVSIAEPASVTSTSPPVGASFVVPVEP